MLYKDLYTHLQKEHAPTHSVAACIIHLNENQKDLSFYKEQIASLLQTNVESENYDLVRHTYLYMVQSCMKYNKLGAEMFNNQSIFEESRTRAQKFLEKYKWTFENMSTVIENPVKKKGWKLGKARQIYALNKDMDRKLLLAMFVKELDIDKGTAATYLHLVKKS